MKIFSRLGLPVVLLAMLALPSLAQQGQVRGELYGLDGEPLGGAQIMLDQIDGAGERHYEMESDGRGQFTHLSVALATYQLTLRVDGRDTAMVQVHIGAGQNPLRLDLSTGELESQEFSRLLGITERVVREVTMVGENERIAVPAGPNPFDNSKEREALAEASAAMREAFDAGRQAMEAQDYEEAILQFTAAADAAPAPQHVIYANIGQAYERLKRYGEAAEQFEKAQAAAIEREIPPETTNYYANLTLMYALDGDVDSALESAEKAAQVDPDGAGLSFFNIGAVLTNAGQTAAAAESFRRATEIAPDMADAFFQAGLAYVSLNSLDESVPFFERYLELRSDGEDAETARQLLEFAAEQ